LRRITRIVRLVHGKTSRFVGPPRFKVNVQRSPRKHRQWLSLMRWLTGRGGPVECCCLLVAFIFAARVEIGLLLPDRLLGAECACECELESLTEELESDDEVEILDVVSHGGSAVIGIDSHDVPLTCVSAALLRPRLTRPPMTRGPPA
jgi:hypothetical protein